jgi:hypothetical protein
VVDWRDVVGRGGDARGRKPLQLAYVLTFKMSKRSWGTHEDKKDPSEGVQEQMDTQGGRCRAHSDRPRLYPRDEDSPAKTKIEDKRYIP